MKKVTLAIAMPVWNPDLGMFKCAMDSIMNQQLKDWRLVIADDGTKDIGKMMDFLMPYLRDPRVEIRFQEHIGLAEAQNFADEAFGPHEYATLTSYDDAFYPHCYSTLVRHAKETKMPFVYGGSDYLLHSQNKVIPDAQWQKENVPRVYKKHNLLIRYFIGYSWIWTKELMDACAPWKDGVECVYSMQLLMEEMSDYRFGYVDKPLVLYRWHQKQTTNTEAAAVKAGNPAISREAAIRRGLDPEVYGWYKMGAWNHEGK